MADPFVNDPFPESRSLGLADTWPVDVGYPLVIGQRTRWGTFTQRFITGRPDSDRFCAYNPQMGYRDFTFGGGSGLMTSASSRATASLQISDGFGIATIAEDSSARTIRFEVDAPEGLEDEFAALSPVTIRYRRANTLGPNRELTDPDWEQQQEEIANGDYPAVPVPPPATAERLTTASKTLPSGLYERLDALSDPITNWLEDAWGQFNPTDLAWDDVPWLEGIYGPSGFIKVQGEYTWTRLKHRNNTSRPLRLTWQVTGADPVVTTLQPGAESSELTHDASATEKWFEAQELEEQRLDGTWRTIWTPSSEDETNLFNYGWSVCLRARYGEPWGFQAFDESENYYETLTEEATYDLRTKHTNQVLISGTITRETVAANRTRREVVTWLDRNITVLGQTEVMAAMPSHGAAPGSTSTTATTRTTYDPAYEHLDQPGTDEYTFTDTSDPGDPEWTTYDTEITEGTWRNWTFAARADYEAKDPHAGVDEFTIQATWDAGLQAMVSGNIVLSKDALGNIIAPIWDAYITK